MISRTMSPVHAIERAPGAAAAPAAPEADPGLAIAACAVQHLGDRKEQQDRVAVLRGRRAPRCVLALLADGVGGRSGGALASEQVITTTQRRFDEFGAEDTAERFFEDLVGELHVVLQIAGAASALEPHSTLAAVLIQPDRVDWCHVGDSRVYHVREGRVRHRTLDDTYGEQLRREGRLSPDRARLHPAAGRLTQALGGSRVPCPTVTGLRRPRVGDAFLLASDGAYTDLSDAEIAETVTAHAAPRDALAVLVERARERAAGRGDNCSMVLLTLVGVGGGGIM
jgi:serine/threonine protein phosphatase PrpC